MKRLVAGLALVGAVGGVAALFGASDRTPAPHHAVGYAAPRHRHSPNVRLRPPVAGTVAPAVQGAAPRPLTAGPTGGAAPESEPGPDCEHQDDMLGSAGTLDPGNEDRIAAENAQRAKAVIEKGTAEILAALRGPDRPLAVAVHDQLLEDGIALCERDLLSGLLADALDGNALAEVRQQALDLLGRAPGTDEETLKKIASLSVSDALDAETRYAAVAAIRQLAMDRDDLAAQTRTALLDAAAKSDSSDLRGDALTSIHSERAGPDEISRIAKFLEDQDPTVRVATAIALAGADPEVKGQVAGAIETAFAKEQDPDAAGALASTALRVARGDAAALLERLADMPVAKANVQVARQIQDYRSLLADGETDPVRIEQIHTDREDARVSGGN